MGGKFMSDNQNAKAPEEGSRMDALVKVVLVFFISVLSFSVGTFVGKQVSDNDHRRASLEGDSHGGGHEAMAASEGHGGGDAHGSSGHEAVAEEDVEDLASEFVKDERSVASVGGHEAPADENGYKSYNKQNSHEEKAAGGHEEQASHEPDSKAEEHGQPHTAKKSGGHEEQAAEEAHPAKKQAGHTFKAESFNNEEPMEAANKVSHGQAPTSGKVVEKPRKPSSSLPGIASTSIGKYTVQVAAYASEGDARKYASQLKSKGWNAFYVPADVKGTTWYRVSVGLFEEPASANSFKSKFLKTSGAKDALVVKIVQ
tara:strand:- start:2736 stop:3677 length:942 start_codon:yes stop_codon:yes gene_type:complete